MRGFVAVTLGMVVGVAAAAVVAVAVYSLIPPPPVPTPPSTPAPEAVAPTPHPDQTPTPGDAASPDPGRSPAPSELVGRPAPPLVALGIDGATIDLASYLGRPVWLVFGDSRCEPCRDEYPLMNGFAARYGEAGLAVLAVHVGEDAATARAFIDELLVTFPVALDGDRSRADTWLAADLPVHFWIDRSGVVREAAVGPLTPDLRTHHLAVILPGVVIGD
jgi:peroxiredoxin